MFLYLQYINLYLYWQGPESSDTREHECRDVKWSDRDTLINKHPSLVASDPLRKTRPPPRRTLMQKCLKTSQKCLQKPPRSGQNETLDAPWSLPGGKPPQVGEIPSQRDTFRRPMCPTGRPMGPQNPKKSPKSSPKCLLKRYFAQLPTMHQKLTILGYPKNLENGPKKPKFSPQKFRILPSKNSTQLIKNRKL